MGKETYSEIIQEVLTGERALFNKQGLRITLSTFEDGESPLKECSDIEVVDSSFKWKYPLWYCNNINVSNSVWFEGARAGVWYTSDITVKDSEIEAPKNFRKCQNLVLENVNFFDAKETLWNCKDVVLKNVTARGDYFGMNSENIEIENFTLDGNYSFDGGKNITVTNSKLLSKDAFWNCENVTVKDSYIAGEYIGWNSKNLTFENCTIESLQGFCYIDNLVLKNCTLVNTNLAFEYSSVDATILNKVDSVKNPNSGRIVAKEIGELILEEDKVDINLTEIIVNK